MLNLRRDLLAPILVLILLSIFFVLSRDLFEGNTSVTELHQTSAPNALLYACFFDLALALILYVPQVLITFILVHVSTQLPYASMESAIRAMGYMIARFT